MKYLKKLAIFLIACIFLMVSGCSKNKKIVKNQHASNYPVSSKKRSTKSCSCEDGPEVDPLLKELEDKEFSYSSGVGGWLSNLTFKEKGWIELSHETHNYSVDHTSAAVGQVGKVEQIDEYTYRLYWKTFHGVGGIHGMPESDRPTKLPPPFIVHLPGTKKEAIEETNFDIEIRSGLQHATDQAYDEENEILYIFTLEFFESGDSGDNIPGGGWLEILNTDHEVLEEANN